MAYIGNIPAEKYQTLQKQSFTTSATDTYTLSYSVTNPQDLALFINNVRQNPNDAYSVSGTTLTLSSAITSSDTMYAVFLGRAVETIAPAVGSVTNAMLATPTTINNNADNRVITGSGTTNTLEGEANLTFDGTTLVNTGGALRLQNSTTGSSSSDGLLLEASGNDVYFNQKESAPIYFRTANTDRMQIDASGNLLIGTTNTNVTGSSTTQGINLKATGRLQASVAGDSVIFNRNSDDGELVRFHQAGNVEGTITVSGSTVSYNGFTGTHWSRLSDNSKPTILKGTILESLDDMMDWYYVEFTYGTDTQKESYTLGDGESVGDVITYTYEGTDYQATIRKEGDVKHSKCKVSDTSESKAVYGVFMAWDNDDDTVNDMYVAQTGTFVVRLNSSVTILNKGDLIQSNGDGTGKVQSDDIIRASTVAKVLSTTKIETYTDGSYIVPCSLHC